MKGNSVWAATKHKHSEALQRCGGAAGCYAGPPHGTATQQHLPLTPVAEWTPVRVVTGVRARLPGRKKWQSTIYHCNFKSLNKKSVFWSFHSCISILNFLKNGYCHGQAVCAGLSTLHF